MDALGYVTAALILYLLGLVLFVRFAAFLHGCDDDMKEMLRKPSNRFHLLRKPRSPRPKARLRVA